MQIWGLQKDILNIKAQSKCICYLYHACLPFAKEYFIHVFQRSRCKIYSKIRYQIIIKSTSLKMLGHKTIFPTQVEKGLVY